jgi:hypothetical protein
MCARYFQNSNVVLEMPPKVVNYRNLLYRQAHTRLEATKKQMHRDNFVWFATVPNYGQYYGDIHRRYKPTRPLRLLDISTMEMREVIADELQIPISMIDPNDQYSGDQGNLDAHHVLEPILLKYSLDGTIIEDCRTDDLCAGPTEVVLRGSCVRYVKRIFD